MIVNLYHLKKILTSMTFDNDYIHRNTTIIVGLRYFRMYCPALSQISVISVWYFFVIEEYTDSII